MNKIDNDFRNEILKHAYLQVEAYEKEESKISLLVKEIVNEIDNRYDSSLYVDFPNFNNTYEEQILAIASTQLRSTSCEYKINHLIEVIIGHFIATTLNEKDFKKRTRLEKLKYLYANADK